MAPICLLYVNGSGQLVPIAIQLKQGVREEDKDNNPIFLPSDNWIDWLRAKIYYQSAHGQVRRCSVANNSKRVLILHIYIYISVHFTCCYTVYSVLMLFTHTTYSSMSSSLTTLPVTQLWRLSPWVRNVTFQILIQFLNCFDHTYVIPWPSTVVLVTS